MEEELMPLLAKAIVTEPLPYLDMIRLEQSARVIMTDSGGVQKEAFFYRVPCVTIRDETEWVETVQMGFNRLVAASAPAIVRAYNESAPLNLSVTASPYGDGQASIRHLRIAEKNVSGASARHPGVSVNCHTRHTDFFSFFFPANCFARFFNPFAPIVETFYITKKIVNQTGKNFRRLCIACEANIVAFDNFAQLRQIIRKNRNTGCDKLEQFVRRAEIIIQACGLIGDDTGIGRTRVMQKPIPRDGIRNGNARVLPDSCRATILSSFLRKGPSPKITKWSARFCT